jgi:predicted DNA-binding transcriptional regulator AlpA
MPTVLTLDDLRVRGIHLSDQTLRRMENSGDFPKRLKLSNRKFGYLATEITAWLGDRAASRFMD